MNYTPKFEPSVEYVLGFAFTPSKGGVLLIRRARPTWQAGKLNGVGGKIEETDWCIEDAMTREFLEETGITTQESQWQLFGSHVKEGSFNRDPASYSLHLLATVLTPEQCQELEMTTDEEPIWFSLNMLGSLYDNDQYPGVPGVVMYIAMANNHLGNSFSTLTLESGA